MTHKYQPNAGWTTRIDWRTDYTPVYENILFGLVKCLGMLHTKGLSELHHLRSLNWYPGISQHAGVHDGACVTARNIPQMTNQASVVKWYFHKTRPDILRDRDWSASSTYPEHMSALVRCA